MSNEVLIRNGDKANWGTDSAPIDPKRLPEGVPYKEVTVVNEPLNMAFDSDWKDQCTQFVAGIFGKVSDVILSEEDTKKLIIRYTSTTGGSDKTITVADIWDDLVSNGLTDDSGVYLFTGDQDLSVIVRDCAAFSAFLSNKIGFGIKFTSPGIYNQISHYGHVSSITTAEPVEQRTEVKQLISNELLPNGYPYTDNAVIEFDGNTTGKVSVSDKFYKISDSVLTDTQVKSILIDANGTIVPIIASSDITITSDYIVFEGMICFIKTAGVSVRVNGTEYVFPETGIYTRNDTGAFKLKYTIIHPISSEFLPLATPTDAGAMKQAAAVANVTAAPTAEEFNALLKSLRDAGILATS